MAKKVYSVRFKESFIHSWEEADTSFLEHCARFGISRESGYQWLARAREGGVEALASSPSTPHTYPHATPEDVVRTVIAARKLHPNWGPRKLRPWLLGRDAQLVLPAASSMGEILKREGLVSRRRRRRRTPRHSEPFAKAIAPNDVWTADFKGQFRLGDRTQCYPLTIADSFSRFLIRCDAYSSTGGDGVRKSFESAFREFGLPLVIHTDNGTPFASTAPAGLSKLSAWWVRLGIVPERSAPAHPWQNGRHERMHRTLKAECTKPPERTSRAQQTVFDEFRREFNDERPHEALGQKPPATAFQPSRRPFPRRLPTLEYPTDHLCRKVGESGHFKWRSFSVFVTSVLAGTVLGLLRTSETTLDVYFGPVCLGYISDVNPDLGLLRYER